jgi:putative ABC transport system permease protein
MLRDLRYALRVLGSKVGFTAAAVISLALGIGACTAIFSVVGGVLLRSLPYPDADRIVQLREVSEKGSLMHFPFVIICHLSFGGSAGISK